MWHLINSIKALEDPALVRLTLNSKRIEAFEGIGNKTKDPTKRTRKPLIRKSYSLVQGWESS
jgi:hypothetical protein